VRMGPVRTAAVWTVPVLCTRRAIPGASPFSESCTGGCPRPLPPAPATGGPVSLFTENRLDPATGLNIIQAMSPQKNLSIAAARPLFP